MLTLSRNYQQSSSGKYHRLWESESFILWLLCYAPRDKNGINLRKKTVTKILTEFGNFLGSKNIINLFYEHIKWMYEKEIKYLEEDKNELSQSVLSINNLSLCNQTLFEYQTSSDNQSLSDGSHEIIYEFEDKYQKEIDRIMRPWIDEKVAYMCDGMDNEIIFFESLLNFCDKIIEIIDNKLK